MTEYHKDFLIKAAKQALSATWKRAMSDEISDAEKESIQRLGLAIAISDRGLERVGPFINWDV